MTIEGSISKAPFILEFEDSCGPLMPNEGTYVVFLKAEGHFFIPIVSFPVHPDNTVHWFKKPYLAGGYGPEMGNVPLKKVVDEIKNLVRTYKQIKPPLK